MTRTKFRLTHTIIIKIIRSVSQNFVARLIEQN